MDRRRSKKRTGAGPSQQKTGRSKTENWTGSKPNFKTVRQCPVAHLSYWWFSNFCAHFPWENLHSLLPRGHCEPNCTKFEQDIVQYTLHPNNYFGTDILLHFETRVAQRQVGWKLRPTLHFLTLVKIRGGYVRCFHEWIQFGLCTDLWFTFNGWQWCDLWGLWSSK